MSELLKRLILHPYIFTQLIILSFFVNILALASPIFVMQVLQRYIAYGVTSTLFTLVSGVLIAIFFEFFFRNLRHRIARSLDSENFKIKQLVIDKIQLSKSIYGDLFKKYKYQRLDKLLHYVENIFSANSTIVILDIPFILVFLITIFLIHNTLGAITLTIILLIIILSFVISIFTFKLISKTAIEQSKEGEIINKMINQHSPIKTFNYEIFFQRIWSQVLNNLLPLKQKSQARNHFSNSLLQMIVAITTVAIIGVGSTLVVSSELSVGGLIAANILAARAISPLVKFITIRSNLISGKDAINEIKVLTNLQSDKVTGSVIEKMLGKISVSKLGYRYPNTKSSLFKDINLNVLPGQILVITGPNGSGKTTFAKLLVGILESNDGSISIDGVMLNQLQQPWYRKNVIYLPQELEFIDSSLRINIFGDQPKKDLNYMNEILNISGLKEFIDDQQHGIEGLISSKGLELSPGIRKKVAISRAITTNGKIVVLDEPTELLDYAGSMHVYNLINKLNKQKKTIVICSSDPVILKGATSILNLNPKLGASIFTPKQMEEYQNKIINKYNKDYNEKKNIKYSKSNTSQTDKKLN